MGGIIKKKMTITVEMPDMENFFHTGAMIECIDIEQNLWVSLGQRIGGGMENYEAELKDHIDNSLEEIKADFVALAKTRTRLMSIKRAIEEE